MNDREHRLAEALALMVQQYIETPEGHLDHMFMSAGEHAIRELADLGLITEDSRHSTWSNAGLKLLGRST